jgi:hypothetical protein
MVEAPCCKPEGCGFNSQVGHRIFSMYPILPAAPWAWGLLSLWQKWVPKDNSRGKGQLALSLTTVLPSVSWLCRQCGILNIWQSCGPPLPVTGIALLFFFFYYKLNIYCKEVMFLELPMWWGETFHLVCRPQIGLFYQRGKEGNCIGISTAKGV